MDELRITAGPWSRRAIIAVWTCLLASLALGCAPDPAERIVLRLEALNTLLETHKAEPDVLLEQLEEFVAEHREEWARDKAEFDALSEDRRERLAAKYDNRLGEALLRLMELSEEIQDRLRAEPAKLSKFLALLSEVSAGT